MRSYNHARHMFEAAEAHRQSQMTIEDACRKDGWPIEPLPMRRDPWASFRDMSFHEFAGCCVVVLAIVVAVLG